MPKVVCNEFFACRYYGEAPLQQAESLTARQKQLRTHFPVLIYLFVVRFFKGNFIYNDLRGYCVFTPPRRKASIHQCC